MYEVPKPVRTLSIVRTSNVVRASVNLYDFRLACTRYNQCGPVRTSFRHHYDDTPRTPRDVAQRRKVPASFQSQCRRQTQTAVAIAFNVGNNDNKRRSSSSNTREKCGRPTMTRNLHFGAMPPHRNVWAYAEVFRAPGKTSHLQVMRLKSVPLRVHAACDQNSCTLRQRTH